MELECSRCHKVLDSSEFFKKASSTRGYSYLCKSCSLEYSREHYKSNKRMYLDKNNRHRHKIRKYIEDFKKTHKCAVCGESRPWCLDFHHKDPSTKNFEIGSNVTTTSLETLKKEIDKCILLCANCHRDLHHNAPLS